VALPAFGRRALLLSAGRAAIDRYVLLAGPTAANPQQRRAAPGWDRQLHCTYYAGSVKQKRKPCTGASFNSIQILLQRQTSVSV